MKDAPFKQSMNSGPKPAMKKKAKTIQKVKKVSAKTPKEVKTKLTHGLRTKKVDKKLPKKVKVTKSKKPDKKIPSVKKKAGESKNKAVLKKNTKEQKHAAKKPAKTMKKEVETKLCRKRKLIERTSKKGTWGPPPTKMPKTSIENTTVTNKLENGISSVVPQTACSPWVLKSGVPSALNNSAYNRDFAVVKKSAFCVPKRSTASSTFIKNNLITSNKVLPKENGDLPNFVNGDDHVKVAKNKVTKAKKIQTLRKVKDLGRSQVCSERDICNAKKGKTMTVLATKSALSSQPQRMARLDALAKMHVICSADRRTTAETAKSENVGDCQHAVAAYKGSTFVCKGNRIESNGSRHKFHSRIDVSVAEKEWNFVAQSVQEQSCTEHQRKQTVCSVISPHEQKQVDITKKKRGKAKSDSVERSLVKRSKSDVESAKRKKLFNPVKGESEKCSKNTQALNNKISKRACRKDASLKAVDKNYKTDEKGSKLKETKGQHVKVHETIRMKKTCTYQSVTVNDPHDSKSSNSPPSHVHTSGSNCANIKKISHMTKTPDLQNDTVDPELPPRSPTMGVHCYAANVPSAEKPVSPASQPVGMEAPDCCGYHSTPMIPLAHAQSCHLSHRMALEAHFDGTFPVHRYQQQHLMYSHPSHGDYGCCCSSCLLHPPYSHVPTHPHLLHSGHSFSSDGLCAGCHHHNPCSAGDSVDSVKRQYSYASGCSAHIGAWCPCYDLNSSRHSSCLCQKASPACMATDYSHQALVPCDQTPLDLSRASSSSSSSVQASEQPLRSQCSSPLCHVDHVVFKSAHECSGNPQSKASKPCCRDNSQACQRKACREECVASDLPLDVKRNPQQLLQLTTNKEHKTVHIIRLRHRHHHQMTETKTSQAHLMGQGSTLVSVTEGSTSTSYVCQVAGCQDFSTCIKGSCSKELESCCAQQAVQSLPYATKVSPKTEIIMRQNQNRLLLSKKPTKRKFFHGWNWEGEPTDRLIALTNDSVACLKKCYPAMRHREGDIIKERDCVLLKSGSKDTDLPFVAKVAAFWENPEDGEMMMSLLWYYRPEHTEQGRKPGQMEDEVFASKHKDVNSVACIEDKCYVLTFAEYCRYRARLCLPEYGVLAHSLVVPEPESGYCRQHRLPPDCTSPEMVFFCRSVYDFRQKRILKNPM